VIHRVPRGLDAIGWALAALVWVGDAPAAEPGLGSDAPEAAQRRYSIARGLYAEGRYAEAAAEFDVAFAMLPTSAKLAYNAARCHERAGHLEPAIEAYGAYLRLSPQAPDRVDVEATVAAIRRRLEATLSELVLTTAPAGARITIDDDAPLERPTPVTARLAPGTHRVRFELDGHEASARTVEVVGGQSNAVHAELEATGGVGWRRVVGWSAIGVGAAGLVVGAAYGASAQDAKDEAAGLEARDWRRHDELSADYEAARPIAWLGLVGGAVFTAAGATLLLWPEDGVAQARIELSPTPGGGTAVYRW